MSRRTGFFAAALLASLAVAAALRLPRLELRPMHADEANQAAKTGRLHATGRYDYDATDHHGPSLYWLTRPSLAVRGVHNLAGSREADYRIVPALFGIGLIGLLLLLTDGLGRTAVAAAAILFAISPAMVFYSRYYIQEMLLLFFTLAALGCGWRYVHTGRWAWILLAGAAVGMAHATKETWVLSAVAAAGAGGMTWVLSRYSSRHAERVCHCIVAWQLLAAALVGLLVAAALFSAFGKNWKTPWESILAYGNYLRRGSQGGAHSEPWYYYLQILFAYRPAKGFFWSEGLIAVLAVLGAARSLLGSVKPQAGSSALRCFLTFYTVLLLGIYSAISYKTPWCALSFLMGMILLAGIGVETLFAIVTRSVSAEETTVTRSVSADHESTHRLQFSIPRLRFELLCLTLALGAGHLVWQAYRLNFDPRFVADSRNPYVYAHTPLRLPQWTERFDRLRQRMPPDRDLTVHVVVAENYWPLPWYLRKLKSDTVGYWLDTVKWQEDLARLPMPDILILSTDFDSPALSLRLTGYNGQMLESLRPGSLVQVYVRDELWPDWICQNEAPPPSSPRS